MPHSQDFIDGFRHAISELGREGDDRSADWSEAYQFLTKRAGALELKAIGEFRGITIVADPAIAAGLIEVHHADGRVDRFKTTPALQERPTR